MMNLSFWQIFTIFFAGFTVGYFLRSTILMIVSIKQLKKIKTEEEKIDERLQEVKEKIKKHAEKMEETLGID
ncbi:hypothetical protein ACFL57_03125 [Candidatus Margulisiibacteriota bacterium]